MFGMCQIELWKKISKALAQYFNSNIFLIKKKEIYYDNFDTYIYFKCFNIYNEPAVV